MLSTTKKVNLIEKKKFAVAFPNLGHKVFVVYITAFNIKFDIDDKIFSSKRFQIAYLKINESFRKILSKYANL